jgi:hypothetical protein
MGYQVGDTRRPTLTLSVFDGSTVVVLTTVCEATGVSTVRPTTGASGTWTANASYTLDTPGRWFERWTSTNAVTGLGAGYTEVEIDVNPVSPALGPGQTTGYATVTQYANIIGGTLPTNLARLLRVASRQLDDFLFATFYDTTDAATLAVLAEATCEQVAYMGANGWWSSRSAASAWAQRSTAVRAGTGRSRTSPRSPTRYWPMPASSVASRTRTRSGAGGCEPPPGSAATHADV